MSGLSDLMADDMAIIHDDGFDLSVAATLTSCDGSATGSVVIVFGDQTDGFAGDINGFADNRQVNASAIRSSVSSILGRDPVQGDRVIVASGSQAGTWIVSTCNGDDGDGLVMTLRLDTPHTAGRAVR